MVQPLGLLYPLSPTRRRRRSKERVCLPECFLVCHQISEKSTALWINTFLGVSTLFALWSLAILFRQAKVHLGEQNMGSKFALFQVTAPQKRCLATQDELGLTEAEVDSIVSIFGFSGRFGTLSPPLPFYLSYAFLFHKHHQPSLKQ